MLKNIRERLQEIIPEGKDLVLICVGSDRSTGDAFAPIVGTYLENNPYDIPVFGTLANPVDAFKVQSTMHDIRAHFGKAFVVAVDACMGDFKEIGAIHVYHRPLQPGAGVNLQLPSIGHCSILGTVNDISCGAHGLHTTRLALVMEMARSLAEQLTDFFDERYWNTTRMEDVLAIQELP